MWTEAEDAHLRKHIENGVRFRQIAIMMHKTVGQISGRASRLKLRSSNPGGGVRGKSSWTAERDRRLREGLAAGHSQADMALSLGISQTTVSKRARELGIGSLLAQRRQAARESNFRPYAPGHKHPVRQAPPQISNIRVDGALVPIAQAGDVARVTLNQRGAHQCCFPVGDPKAPDFGYCGLAVFPGASYCPTHLARIAAPSARIQAELQAAVDA